MLNQIILFSILLLNFLNANVIHLTTDKNTSIKTIIPHIETFSCQVIVGSSLKNIFDSPTSFWYIAHNNLTDIPIVNSHHKLYISSESNLSKFIAYGGLLEAKNFFNKKVIFPKKNTCYKNIFVNRNQYLYTLNKGYLFDDNLSTQTILMIDNLFTDMIDNKNKKSPFVYVIIMRDENNQYHFYPFFTIDSINNKLWEMHIEKRYSPLYKKLIEKFESKIKHIEYLDTLAWVYSDNNNSKKALKIYEQKILPLLKKDNNESILFQSNYKELKRINSERLK